MVFKKKHNSSYVKAQSTFQRYRNKQHIIPNYHVNMNFHPENQKNKSNSSSLEFNHKSSAQNNTSSQHNIMYDSRVVRGSTFATPVLTKEQERYWKKKKWELFHQHGNNHPPEKHHNIMRRRSNQYMNEEDVNEYKRQFQCQTMTTQSQSSSSDLFHSTQSHAENQTDCLLEELPPPFTSQDMDQDQDHQTQTSHSPSNHDVRTIPYYSPNTTINYRESSTQIDTSELFDFEEEVSPLLRKLVKNVLENTKMEFAQEEELRMLHTRKEQFRILRSQQIQEIQDILVTDPHCSNQGKYENSNVIPINSFNPKLDSKSKIKYSSDRYDFAIQLLKDTKESVMIQRSSTEKEYQNMNLALIGETIVHQLLSMEVSKNWIDDIFAISLSRIK